MATIGGRRSRANAHTLTNKMPPTMPRAAKPNPKYILSWWLSLLAAV